jgi:hypothetical protein
VRAPRILHIELAPPRGKESENGRSSSGFVLSRVVQFGAGFYRHIATVMWVPPESTGPHFWVIARDEEDRIWRQTFNKKGEVYRAAEGSVNAAGDYTCGEDDSGFPSHHFYIRIEG